MTDITPGEDILHSDIPLLFIHGKDDRYVPPTMSEKIYRERKEKAHTGLYLVDGARHAGAWGVDPAAYNLRLGKFVDSVLENGHGARGV